MNIEKIEKLIESPNIDDKKLGLSFLLEQLGEEGFKDYFTSKKRNSYEWSMVISTTKYEIYPILRGFGNTIRRNLIWSFGGTYKIDLR